MCFFLLNWGLLFLKKMIFRGKAHAAGVGLCQQTYLQLQKKKKKDGPFA